MKSFSVLLVLLTIASTVAFAPLARPSFLASSSSRMFLHPKDAKDLEAVAYLQYSQKLMKEGNGESASNDTSNMYNHQHVLHHHGNGGAGPVAWCRRVLYNWTHHGKDTTATTHTTLRP